MTENDPEIGPHIAEELGIHYDGVQEGIGMQFTDRAETGTTFYADTLEDARTKLADKRILFARARKARIEANAEKLIRENPTPAKKEGKKMATRTEFNACMKPYMTGGGPERKERFCTGAKICSGKAKTEEEARRLCAEAATNPKEPKKPKARRTKTANCQKEMKELAKLVAPELGVSEAILSDVLQKFSCGKAEEKPSREKFIKKCFKENAVTGDIKEAQKLRSLCAAKWKESEATL